MIRKLKLKKLQNQLLSYIPDIVKTNAGLTLFTLFKIPLLFFLTPRIERLDEECCIVVVPLSKRSQNHLNSMYFAALAAGADCAGAVAAFKEIHNSGKDVSLVFKDFRANFVKRATGDTHFICNEISKVRALVQKTIETGERENCTVKVEAVVPSESNEPVAFFELTLSLKAKS